MRNLDNPENGDFLTDSLGENMKKNMRKMKMKRR